MKDSTTLSTGRAAEHPSDVLVVPVFAGKLADPEVTRLDHALRGQLLREARHQGFHGRRDEALLFQTHGRLAARNIVLVGCEAPVAPVWHQIADLAVRFARETRAHHVNVLLGAHATADAVRCMAEGLLLTRYRFTRFRSQPDATPPLAVALTVAADGADLRKAIRHGEILGRAACHARDLVNTPAADLRPEDFARHARRLVRKGLRLRVHDRRAIVRLRMGALAAVARGSSAEPRFLEMTYRPGKAPRKRIALVGKGVTFDSGGLCLKTADSMRTQKRDMAGAAAVLAVMTVLPDLALPVEVRGYMPLVENMPGGDALRPGDVVRTRSGKTVEVLNTDAEGRLILADALAYAAEHDPDAILDFATLTAAVNTALGGRCAAIMGSDAELVRACIGAAAAANERLWELPLIAEYRRDLDSTVADLKNIGEGQAGTIVAGLFLREFTGNLPWAHVDFSSTATTTGHVCHPAGATGFGVRTVLHYLQSL